MPNGFMLSIDTRERKNICLSSKEKITNIIAVVICIQLQLQDEWKHVFGDIFDLEFFLLKSALLGCLRSIVISLEVYLKQ